MPTYIFCGKVLPDRAAVSITPPIRLAVRVPEANIDFEATIAVEVSQVSVVVETQEQVRDFETLRNYVELAVRCAVDAFGYLTGRGYNVEITSVQLLDGQGFGVFGVQVPELERLASERPVKFNELWELLTGAQTAQRMGPLRHALRHLREALAHTVIPASFATDQVV